jgi:hypothetical protein
LHVIFFNFKSCLLFLFSFESFEIANGNMKFIIVQIHVKIKTKYDPCDNCMQFLNNK